MWIKAEVPFNLYIDVSCIYKTAMFSFLGLLGVTEALKDYQIDFYGDFK